MDLTFFKKKFGGQYGEEKTLNQKKKDHRTESDQKPLIMTPPVNQK